MPLVSATPLLSTPLSGGRLCGFVLACLVFYSIGRMLLALPDSFHDGSMWQMEFPETEEP